MLMEHLFIQDLNQRLLCIKQTNAVEVHGICGIIKEILLSISKIPDSKQLMMQNIQVQKDG
jgi:hypothetical protein